MKQCRGCGEVKDELDFAFRSKAASTRKARCRACDKIRDAEIWRSGNKKETSAITRAALRKKNEDWLWQLLTASSCVDCKASDPRVLEFDHLGDKEYNVSSMIRDFSLENLQREVNKCEIVCANCHRIRTSDRAGFWRSVRIMAV